MHCSLAHAVFINDFAHDFENNFEIPLNYSDFIYFILKSLFLGDLILKSVFLLDFDFKITASRRFCSSPDIMSTRQSTKSLLI